MRIAVIGTGISGMLAARLLDGPHEVHVFEANDYVGGHTQTIRFEAFGREYAVDTGFMVFNHQTYPRFVRMLRLLGIDDRDSDMSFSVRCDRTGLEYQGSTLGGLFAQRANVFSPGFLGMLADVVRFNRQAQRLLDGGDDGRQSLGEYLKTNGYGRRFIDYYLVPMGASIWSARPDTFLEFPAGFVVKFFTNHSLLQIRGGPQWKTIPGGSARYGEALMAPLGDRIRLSSPVAEVSRRADHVLVRPRGGSAERFDAVVLACHSDQALGMLADPSPAEREILGAIPYQRNEAVLHLDSSLLPRNRRAWASWNYRLPLLSGRPVMLTYNLNRLQGHESPGPICVTLNGTEAVDPRKIIRRMDYAHPVFTPGALAVSARLTASGARITAARTGVTVSTRTECGRRCGWPPASAAA
jgi:predicted NAD/FAD-binding protein